MQTGTVKWFNNLKGYGFISPEEGGEDVFMHFSDIESETRKQLEEGQAVHFVCEDNGKGPQAVKVTII